MALFGFGKKKQDIIAAAAGLNFEEKPKKEEAAVEEVVEEIPAGPSILDEVKEEMDAMKPSELKANFGKNADGSLAEEEPQEVVEEPAEEGGFFKKLVAGLSKTRDNFVRNMDYAFGATEINDDFYEELEEILISGDIGVRTTDAILEKLKEEVRARKIVDPTECKQVLVDAIRSQMDLGDAAYEFEKQRSVVFVIGVNGVGKTTTIGKLAAKLKAMDKKVVIAAADTFRAAAGDQLREWANRVGVDMIGGQDGSDPAAVVFDAIASAKAKNADVLLIDTAGRLHNKKNLMDELSKMNRIIEREYPGAYKESLVVLDATTGQNALNQAKEFKEAADLTGVVLTKMDGTAKGGIAVAIQSELGVPVKYIGVGESVDDLEKFDANQFVKALFL